MALQELLGDAAKTDLTQKITVFLVAWFFIKRTVKEHFVKIETGLQAVATNVSELKQELVKIQLDHSSKIDALQDDVKLLGTRVTELEGTTN